MENKMVRVPFAVEIAKKITNGEVNGNIVTRDGRNVRVICWDKKSDSIYNIVALLDEKIMERILTYTINGSEADGKDSDNDLMLEIPEYMTFKDGDILTYRPNGDRLCIFIYKGNDSGLMHNYVTYDCDSRGNNIIKFGESSYISTLCELSTESEKQKLIEALKASREPKAKEYLKRFFGIEQKQEYEFKPFDKVLVRQCTEDKWEAMIFSNYTDKIHKYRCCGMNYMHCIPYNDQTAHLLGTNKDWEETK